VLDNISWYHYPGYNYCSIIVKVTKKWLNNARLCDNHSQWFRQFLCDFTAVIFLLLKPGLCPKWLLRGDAKFKIGFLSRFFFIFRLKALTKLRGDVRILNRLLYGLWCCEEKSLVYGVCKPIWVAVRVYGLFSDRVLWLWSLARTISFRAWHKISFSLTKSLFSFTR
jgi:hypothetical protein